MLAYIGWYTSLVQMNIRLLLYHQAAQCRAVYCFNVGILNEFISAITKLMMAAEAAETCVLQGLAA